VSAESEIEKLADYIIKHFAHEVDVDGAGTVAIKILEKYRKLLNSTLYYKLKKREKEIGRN